MLQTLKGHIDCVNSVATSPDGKQLVSASRDKIMRLWNSTTSAVLQTLEGHTNRVSLVTFSLDDKAAGVSFAGWDNAALGHR